MPSLRRSDPNILVTGTPGAGKSAICKLVAEKTNYAWREVSKMAEEYDCLDGFDLEFENPFLNEDKLMGIMESMIAKGGNIVDYHVCEFFPEEWFDVVFVIRTTNHAIYERLTERGYSEMKVEDYIQIEIFDTVLQEAEATFKPEMVKAFENHNEHHLQFNVKAIVAWIKRWKADNNVVNKKN